MNWILFTPEWILLVSAALFLVMACLKTDPAMQYRLAVSMAAIVVAAGVACVGLSGELFGHGPPLQASSIKSAVKER